MWENLKIGLRKCQLKTRSRIFCLVLLLLPSLPLFSLSPEEIEALPGLSKTDLIDIIMIYDQAMTENEKDLIPLLMSQAKLEAELQASKIELTLQENLSQMLLNQHRIEMKAEFERGLKTGITIGSFGGSVFSGVFAIAITKIE